VMLAVYPRDRRREDKTDAAHWADCGGTYGTFGMRLGTFLISALKAPLWVAAIPTGAKSFVGNPVIGSPRLNRWGLHVGRMRLAASLGRQRRRWLGRRVAADFRSAYARDGFVVMPDFLPPAEFDRLRAEVLDAPWDAHEMRQGSTVTRRVLLDVAELRQT